MSEILILRAEPGASQTASRAEAIGLVPVIAPIFTVCAVPWEVPDPGDFEAVILTSANAARHAGPSLSRFLERRCYAVGEATAAEARQAGFRDMRIGQADAAALLPLLAADGVRTALHPCGRDHKALAAAGISIRPAVVYEVMSLESLPATAIAALERSAIALLHSPRAAAHFAALADRTELDRNAITLAAISTAAAAEASSGWGAVQVAAQPRDAALLELAAKLCNIRNRPG